jgi:putative ABC transport system substrate-binding protein
MTLSRRALLVSGGLAGLAVPLAAMAQPGKVPRVGLLESGALAPRAPLWDAFRQVMRELGYVEGRSVIFEVRSAEGQSERLRGLATELVGLKVDVIVTGGSAAAQAASQATTTIPIVTASGNPFDLGLVPSLARPGGNLTGVATLSIELAAKRLELARQVVPGATRLAIMGDAGSPSSSPGVRQTQEAAQVVGVRLHAVTIGRPDELAGIFAKVARERAAVLIVVPSPLFFGERRRLADLAVKHRLPTVFGASEYAEAGGLIAYGADLADTFRKAPAYVDKILKGARPGDLPIDQAMKLRLVVNLKTARAIGLTVPAAVLARADQVLE